MQRAANRTPGPPNEGGFALFYALLATLVVAGIIAIVFATAVSEDRQSAFELDFEDTVHVAEAGAEIYLQRLAIDAQDDSGIVGPASDEDPAAWAIEEATRKSDGTNYDLPVIDVGEGETVAIRPLGDDAEFIYGVGFTPTREAWDDDIGNPYVRVVRVQVAFSPSVVPGENALLAGGNLKMDGGFDIDGTNGSVHTNGGLEVSGTSGSVEQGITYSGSCAMDPCEGTASAPISGPVSSTPIPRIQLLEVWATDDAREIAADGLWYDNCGGTWYQRQVSDTFPCTPGNEMAGSPVPWNGTTFEGTDGSNPDAKGVFFFRDETDLDIKRPNGQITIMTGGSMTVGPSADQPAVSGLYPGLFLLADGDITFSGNFNGAQLDDPSLVFTNETLKFVGNPSTDNIAFIARDTLQAGSDYGGTGTVTYNGGAAPDLGTQGFPLVVQWDEVR